MTNDQNMWVLVFEGQTVIGPFYSVDSAQAYKDKNNAPFLKMWAVEPPGRGY